MRKSPSILRFSTFCVAALLFAASFLVSLHNHPTASPEGGHHCVTCQLLPQGLQLVKASARPQLPVFARASEIFEWACSPTLSRYSIPFPIRGPPAA
ncbi:MAG: hypothetical protein U1F66_09090 [bacterium]